MATIKSCSLLVVPMLAALAVVWVLTSSSVSACGGFFCTTTPVDQNAERIIFTQNGDGTVSAYVQIEYTGEAPDFSWILPLPEAIAAEDVEVPEDAMAAFTELEVATDPVFLMPPCRTAFLASSQWRRLRPPCRSSPRARWGRTGSTW